MIRFAVTLTAVLALVAGVWAQPHYLVGNFNGWADPAVSPGPQMLDDGVAPDAAAGDGIYTATLSDPGGVIGDFRGIKVTGGGWGVNEIPPNANNHDYQLTAVPASITVYLNTNSQGDGWTPDSNFFTTDSPESFSSVTAVGNFQDNIPGGGSECDSSDANTLMDDSGSDPNDTASDGIYTLTVQVDTIGSYEWKAVYDNSWGREFTPDGFTSGGPNLTFSTSITDEIVILEVNTATGRSRATATGVPVTLSVFSME